MDWNKFSNKFHKSWHSYIKPFIESKECDKIYMYLKSSKKEIAPKSSLTFRAFERPLQTIKCVVLLEEPYSDKQHDLQYADGIPLSCEFVDKIHPQLDAFYNAMEKEFYDLNLNMIKQMNLDFYINQGVLFLSSSLTTEIGSPGKHKRLWEPFIKHLITNIFIKNRIPIIFCGEQVYEQYKWEMTPIYPYILIKQPISEAKIGIPWNTDGAFTKLNKYLYEKTDYEEIMWVNMDVPF